MMRSVFVLFTLSLALAAEDVLVLQNGSDVSGTIVAEEGDTLVIHIANPPGDMVFPYKDILSINGISADEIRRIRALTDEKAMEIESRTGMAFGGPVSRMVRTPLQLEEALATQAKEDVVPLKASTRNLSLRYLGLVPGDFDFEAYLRQVPVAFSRAHFDRERVNLWLVLDRRGVAPKSNEPDWGVEWFLTGVGSGEEEFDLVHALGHYAASQIVDGGAAAQARDGNDDAALAFEAFWEGIADLVALETVFERVGLDAARVRDAQTAVMHVPHRNALVALGAPLPFRRRVFFARDHGVAFLSAGRRAQGWKVLRRALSAPPVSTEQVLHPEKYFCEKDLPIVVRPPNPLLGIGAWDVIDEDTLGEFGTSLVLSQGNEAETAAKAAAGWGGDRWQVFRSSEGALGLVWLTVWDTEADAREFASAAAKWLEKRHGGAGLTPEGDLLAGRERGTVYFIERKGEKVLVSDGFPREVREALRNGMWTSEVLRPGGTAETWVSPAEWKAAQETGLALADLVKPPAPATPSGKLGTGGFDCPEQGFALAASGEWQLLDADAADRQRGVFVKARVRMESASAEVRVDALEKGTAPGLYFAAVLRVETQLAADKKQQVVSRSLSTVAGRPALVWVVIPSELVDGMVYRVKQVAIALDGRAVRFRFAAPDESFASLEPHLSRLLDGFTVK